MGCRCPACIKHRHNKHLKYYYKRGGKKHDSEYKQKNKERDRPLANARAAKRRAIKEEASVNLTPDEKLLIQEIYIKCKNISKSTGIPHQVDHIIPISKGGLHHPSNLQILTKFENLSKGAKIL
jgi:5-methylcytosine-specific restriction endonuclease McrA